MYAMDSAVHTEHSSEPRRSRRESWHRRWQSPTSPSTDATDDASAAPDAGDFAD